MHHALTKYLFILFFLGLLGAACAIPFYVESPSMFYKTGMDRILLRSGKIAGIITALLMLFQPVLMARFRGVDQAFGVKRLFQTHRINGLILLLAALLHPVLILGADDFVFFPFESRYWPEFTGVTLLVLLIPFVAVSFFVKQMGLNYKTWRLFHKMLAQVLVILMGVHVINVSKSFETGLPFFGLCAGIGIMILLFIRKLSQ